MKTFKEQETLLLIEESDLDDKIASRLRPAKDNEDFMKQALCCISITGVKYYITHERIT